MVVADGPPCQGTCTGRGHLEALASGNAADRAAEKLWGEGASAELLVGRAEEGDPDALEALAGIGQLLGAAIGSFVNIFAPELTIVGGGFGDRCGRVSVPRGARGRPARGARARRRAASGSSRPSSARRGNGRRGPARVRGDSRKGVRCRSPSARRRSAISTTSRSASSRELEAADVVLCEDTRQTKGLLERHGIHARLLELPRAQRGAAYRGAAAAARSRRADRARLGRRPAGGQRPGRASDRGRARCGRPVTVLPGPSAVETALVASGLVGERYRFIGFLPRGAKARGELWAELGGWDAPRRRVRVATTAAGHARARLRRRCPTVASRSAGS